MRVLETYARALLEAAKTEGRVFEDLKHLDAIASSAPEVIEVLRTLVERVDPSIIGGIVLEMRGQRRDISVKTQLRAARESLSSVHLDDESHGGETAHV